MFELHKLTPLVKKRKRVGRGGSRGGTSGKGHKGQKARSGGSDFRVGFEGGQMPLYRRLPKRGFNNTAFQDVITVVNIERLNDVFNDGDVVNRENLILKGIIKPLKGIKSVKIKILGEGILAKKLSIHADAFSKSALKAIQEVGGEAHYNRES